MVSAEIQGDVVFKIKKRRVHSSWFIEVSYSLQMIYQDVVTEYP